THAFAARESGAVRHDDLRDGDRPVRGAGARRMAAALSADNAVRRSFRRLKARLWAQRGRVPHAYGYNAAKWFAIERGVHARDARYGWNDGGLDERVVEYAWMFERVATVN